MKRPPGADDSTAPCSHCGTAIRLTMFHTPVYAEKRTNTQRFGATLRRHEAACRDKTDEEREFFRLHYAWPPTARARMLREKRNRRAS